MLHYEKHSESREALLSEDPYLQVQNRTPKIPWLLLTTINTLLFFCSTAIFIRSVGGFGQTPWPRNAALKATSTYSPILDDFNLPLSTIQINSSLFGEIPSPWREPPNSNSKHEDAWEQFEHIRTLPITADRIRRMGKDPSTVAKFEDKIWHMGNDAYIGAMDIFHQIHCLNLLRKAAFDNHQGGKLLDRIHLQHCTDMLMQHLLCTADTGMITYQWKEENEHPFPDFGVQRECKDWRRLVEYRDEKAVELEKYMLYTKPEWVEELKQPKEYWELMRELDEDEKVEHHHR